MSDRESVKIHLQIIHVWASFALEQDINFFNEKHLQSISKWTDEALDLICGQSAVEPVVRKNKDGFKYCYCGSCGFELMAGKPKYCSECGREVDWDAPDEYQDAAKV